MADFTFNMIPEGAGVGKVIFPILKNGDCGVSPIGQIYLSVGGIKSDEDQIEGTKIEIQIGEDPRLKAIAIESEYKGLIAAFIKDCPEQLALENSMFTLTKIVPGSFSLEDDISGPTLPSWEPEILLFSENGMNEIGMTKGGMGHYYIPEDHVKVVTLFTGTEIFEQEIGTESAGAILNEDELGEEAEEVEEMEYEITYTAKYFDIFPLNSHNPLGGSWIFIDKHPIPSEIYNLYGFYVDNTMCRRRSTNPTTVPILLVKAKANFNGLKAGIVVKKTAHTDPVEYYTYDVQLPIERKLYKEREEDGEIIENVKSFSHAEYQVGDWVIFSDNNNIKNLLPSSKLFHENVKEPGKGFSE